MNRYVIDDVINSPYINGGLYKGQCGSISVMSG